MQVLPWLQTLFQTLKNKIEEEAENSKGEQWIEVQKIALAKQNSKTKGKGVPTGIIEPPLVQGEGSTGPPRADISNSPFEILIISEEPLVPTAEEKVEQQPITMVEDKRAEETDPLKARPPKGVSSSPFYADMTRKKLLQNSGSLEDETIESPSKRVGRKSHREAREEEDERQNMQGSQPAIEISIGKNTRTGPPKEGYAPSSASK